MKEENKENNQFEKRPKNEDPKKQTQNIYFDKAYPGADKELSCYVRKGKKCGTMLRNLKKWDTRFLMLDGEECRLTYSKKPNASICTNIPLTKVNGVERDSGYSKKGRVVVLFCPDRLFFFQFDSDLMMNKFLLIMAYIVNGETGLPLYIFTEKTVNNAKLGDEQSEIFYRDRILRHSELKHKGLKLCIESGKLNLTKSETKTKKKKIVFSGLEEIQRKNRIEKLSVRERANNLILKDFSNIPSDSEDLESRTQRNREMFARKKQEILDKLLEERRNKNSARKARKEAGLDSESLNGEDQVNGHNLDGEGLKKEGNESERKSRNDGMEASNRAEDLQLEKISMKKKGKKGTARGVKKRNKKRVMSMHDAERVMKVDADLEVGNPNSRTCLDENDHQSKRKRQSENPRKASNRASNSLKAKIKKSARSKSFKVDNSTAYNINDSKRLVDLNESRDRGLGGRVGLDGSRGKIVSNSVNQSKKRARGSRKANSKKRRNRGGNGSKSGTSDLLSKSKIENSIEAVKKRERSMQQTSIMFHEAEVIKGKTVGSSPLKRKRKGSSKRPRSKKRAQNGESIKSEENEKIDTKNGRKQVNADPEIEINPIKSDKLEHLIEEFTERKNNKKSKKHTKSSKKGGKGQTKSKINQKVDKTTNSNDIQIEDSDENPQDQNTENSSESSSSDQGESVVARIIRIREENLQRELENQKLAQLRQIELQEQKVAQMKAKDFKTNKEKIMRIKSTSKKPVIKPALRFSQNLKNKGNGSQTPQTDPSNNRRPFSRSSLSRGKGAVRLKKLEDFGKMFENIDSTQKALNSAAFFQNIEKSKEEGGGTAYHLLTANLPSNGLGGNNLQKTLESEPSHLKTQQAVPGIEPLLLGSRTVDPGTPSVRSRKRRRMSGKIVRKRSRKGSFTAGISEPSQGAQNPPTLALRNVKRRRGSSQPSSHQNGSIIGSSAQGKLKKAGESFRGQKPDLDLILDTGAVLRKQDLSGKVGGDGGGYLGLVKQDRTAGVGERIEFLNNGYFSTFVGMRTSKAGRGSILGKTGGRRSLIGQRMSARDDCDDEKPKIPNFFKERKKGRKRSMLASGKDKGPVEALGNAPGSVLEPRKASPIKAIHFDKKSEKELKGKTRQTRTVKGKLEPRFGENIRIITDPDNEENSWDDF